MPPGLSFKRKRDIIRQKAAERDWLLFSHSATHPRRSFSELNRHPPCNLLLINDAQYYPTQSDTNRPPPIRGSALRPGRTSHAPSRTGSHFPIWLWILDIPYHLNLSDTRRDKPTGRSKFGVHALACLRPCFTLSDGSRLRPDETDQRQFWGSATQFRTPS